MLSILQEFAGACLLHFLTLYSIASNYITLTISLCVCFGIFLKQDCNWLGEPLVHFCFAYYRGSS